MKLVMAFEKKMYIGKGYECNRLIRKLEKSGVATLQDFQRGQINDNDTYGIYIDKSGFYNVEPTIIILESRSVSNILLTGTEKRCEHGY